MCRRKGKQKIHSLLPFSRWCPLTPWEVGLQGVKCFFWNTNIIIVNGPPSPPFPQLLLLSTHPMAWNIPLVSVGQLAWLCPLPGSCPLPPCWWGSAGAKPLQGHNTSAATNAQHSPGRAAMGKANSIPGTANTIIIIPADEPWNTKRKLLYQELALAHCYPTVIRMLWTKPS